MTPAEVKRRCQALLALAPDDRPISVSGLQEIAGLPNNAVWRYASGYSAVDQKTYLRLDRAFRLLENGQLGQPTGKYKEAFAILTSEPARKQINVLQVRLTPGGIRSGFAAVNPNAFTALPRLIDPLPGTETRVRHSPAMDRAREVKLTNRAQKA